jgi:hypothetical protein
MSGLCGSDKSDRNIYSETPEYFTWVTMGMTKRVRGDWSETIGRGGLMKVPEREKTHGSIQHCIGLNT